MNKPLKDKWTTALTADSYQQGRGRLRGDDNRYCCLGVLCDVLDPSKWKSTSAGPTYVDNNNYCMGNLSPSMLDRIGLTPDQQQTLIGMNDEGKSFHTIAEYIKKNL